MNKINFFTVADNAEMKNGKLYIEGIFDSINSYSFPAMHKSLAIAINFEITPGKHAHSFKIKYGTSSIVDSANFEFDVPTTSARYQFLHRVNDLPIPKEGKYTIEAHVDGKLIGETYFIAKSIPKPSYA